MSEMPDVIWISDKVILDNLKRGVWVGEADTHFRYKYVRAASGDEPEQFALFSDEDAPKPPQRPTAEEWYQAETASGTLEDRRSAIRALIERQIAAARWEANAVAATPAATLAAERDRT